MANLVDFLKMVNFINEYLHTVTEKYVFNVFKYVYY